MAWSLDPTASVLDAERAAALPGDGLGARSVGPAGLESRPSGRSLVALAVLCLAGLADAAVEDDPFGAVTDDPGSEDRLAEPVGYANGMAVLAAMGTLLAIGLALVARRPAPRAACLLLLPLFIATLYLTYSRGAWLALAIGLLALFATRIASLDRRIVVAGCVVILVAVTAAGVAFARSFAAPTATPVGVERLRTFSGSSRGDYWRVALRAVEMSRCSARALEAIAACGIETGRSPSPPETRTASISRRSLSWDPSGSRSCWWRSGCPWWLPSVPVPTR